MVKSGLTLNEKKCVFSTNECDFFGLHFSKEGITTQISKIEALKNASSPKNVSELRSILGLAQYCGRSIEQLATLTQPLRELTKSKTKWNWTNEHEEVLDKLKESLTTVTMAYFNKNWRTEQTVDASPVGLGVVMAQYNPSDPNERKIVQYASKSLTEVDRYSQVEKEALAVVYACEKFHLYIYGCEFDIVTDNKAVELIYGNENSKPKARIERWCLRLLP